MQKVLARDKVWRLQQVTEVAEGRRLFSLVGHSDAERLEVLSPPDEVELIADDLPTLSKDALTPYQSWRAAHEALRLSQPPGDALMSIYGGRISPERYQFLPVQKILSLPRPCLLIADDVGLGKTIEAGLCILELMARGRAKRVLIVLPPGLIPQWQEEMRDKFGLYFETIENAASLERAQTSLAEGIKPWVFFDRVITSTEYLKKQEVYNSAFSHPWDIVIVDEAHYLAESGTTINPYLTNRTRLGKKLRQNAEAIILLTATPHNGYTHSFRSLLEIVEPTDATLVGDAQTVERRISRNMVRRLKRHIWKTDEAGKRIPAFKLRDPVKPIEVKNLCPEEKAIFDKVSSYCAKTSKAVAGTEQEDVISFVMQIIKKRMLSSRAALDATVGRRLDALKARGEPEELPSRSQIRELQGSLPLSDSEQDRITQKLLSAVPKDVKQRKAEVKQLEDIRKLLQKISTRPDPKLQALLDDIKEHVLPQKNEKAIVFTEYRDTLESIKALFVDIPELANAFVELTGSLSAKQRRERISKFESPDVRILLATDAASEGLNLQRFCRRVYHLELPWNPNRLEQRNGRIDRHGQTRTPIIKYLYYPDSPEDGVLHALVRKINQIQSDEVCTPDILGLVDGLQLEDSITAIDATSSDRKEPDALVKKLEDKVKNYQTEFSPLLSVTKSYSLDANSPDTCADFILADDTAAEELMQFAFGSLLKPVELAGCYTLRVPREYQTSGVLPVYPCLTFRRSVAIQYPAADVEFVTRLHPLFKSIVSFSYNRLTIPKGKGLSPARLAVRRHRAVKQPCVVFTFLGSNLPPLGTLLSVALTSDGRVLDESVINLAFDAGQKEGEVSWNNLTKSFADTFPKLRDIAQKQVEGQQKAREGTEAEKRRVLVKALRSELDSYKKDRLAEIDKEEADAKFGKERQLSFLKEVTGFQAKRAAVDSYCRKRLEELEKFETQGLNEVLQPLGAIFIFPEEK